MRVISYGGGVQSSALIVLAAQGRIGQVDAALFSNVGDDSEHPATLAYVRDVMTPWAAEHGLRVEELRHHRWTVYRKATETLGGVIPLRGVNGAPMKRGCTVDFKVKVIERWMKERGATPDNPYTSLIGISVDEIQRARTALDTGSVNRREHPLLDLGMTRADCAALITEAGLPVPPKSACWFCPFHTAQTWAEMRRDEPDLFEKAVEMERSIIQKNAERGLRPLYLSGAGRPLDEAINEAQPSLWGGMGDFSCDEGVCFV